MRDRDAARSRHMLEGGGAVIAALVLVLGAACDGPVRTDRDSGGHEDGGGDGGGQPGTDAGRDSGGDPTPDAGRDAGLPPVAPLFRNAVDLPDDELAREALRLMGAPEAGGSGSCSDCHAITRQNIRRFWDISDAAWRTCFTDLTVESDAAAQSIVDCFQRDVSLYTATNVGVFATGADFEWFRYVFRRALGAGWAEEYETFRARVLQPPDPHPPLTQAEFDLLTEWFLRGTPWVENVLPSTDGPGECTDYVDASVSAIVEDGELNGWPARNREAAILMHGCAGATDPLECLSSYPRVTETTYGATWETPGTEHRVLFEVPYRTSYWTKSSADGRFVAHGGNNAGGNASIIDLARAAIIRADARYDPGFFPDNSGFIFHGTSRGAVVCMQSLLTAGSPTRITFSEEGCNRAASIGLYEHVGASLDGGDYWAVDSLWSGDLGDSGTDADVMASPAATLNLRRLVNTGSGFTLVSSTRLDVPWEANAVVSPTMRFVVTQLATASGDPLGFVLRRIDITRGAGGAVSSIRIPEVARYCYPGGKAAMSLDDRWIVTHHRATDADAVDLGFTGPDDPGFAAYRGVSNVYLIDTATGERVRVTNMQPGQRALFPHFRSDGWLYYLARSGPTGSLPEYVVASNAGIVLR